MSCLHGAETKQRSSKLENQSVQTAVLWSGDNDPVKDDRSYGKYG
jgi:hypothetical protein